MGFIQDFFGRILYGKRKGGDDGYRIIGSTGKPLNHLYNPKPKKDDYDEAERLMDEYMESFGYRKLIMGKDIPRPKRRFLKKSERMNVGDRKTMARITKF